MVLRQGQGPVSDVDLEELDEIRRLGHGLLEFRETERPVFVVVALVEDVFDDPRFLFAGEVLVVVEDQTIDHLSNVVTTWKQWGKKVNLRNPSKLNGLLDQKP